MSDTNTHLALVEVIREQAALIRELTEHLMQLKREGFQMAPAGPEATEPSLPDGVLAAIAERAPSQQIEAVLRDYAARRLRAGAEAAEVAEEIVRGGSFGPEPEAEVAGA